MKIFTAEEFYVIVDEREELLFVTMTGSGGFKHTTALDQASRFTNIENAKKARKENTHKIYRVFLREKSKKADGEHSETWSWIPEN